MSCFCAASPPPEQQAWNLSAALSWMLVDLHNDSIALILYRLVDGAYVEERRAVPGETFRMTEPFAFEVDPAELLDS